MKKLLAFAALASAAVPFYALGQTSYSCPFFGTCYTVPMPTPGTYKGGIRCLRAVQPWRHR